MKNKLLNILIFVCAFTISGNAFGQSEVDHLALATTLAADGHFDRAKTALINVDIKNENTDLENFYLVSGLVELNMAQWKLAIGYFEKLLHASQKKELDPLVFGYYAQALHGDAQYEKALLNANKVGEKGHKDPGLWLLKIDCEQKLSKNSEAWNTINKAGSFFPKDIRFQRIRVKLLLELRLFSSAAEHAAELMKNPSVVAEDALALGEGLRKGGALKRAIAFLEHARLRFRKQKEHTKLTALLAYCYAQQGNYSAAAELLALAAEKDERFRIESAEMFIKAGNIGRAKYHNSLVRNQKTKLRQRVAILVELGNFEGISALYPRLKRLKVLEDDALGYAVAYAQFQTSDFKAAMKTLKGIKDPGYFDSATKLREIILRCQKEDTCSR